MAYHAAVCAAETPRFPRGERGEVVVVHKTLFGLYLHAFNELGVFWSAEGEHREHVSTAAVEDAGAVEDGRDAAGLGKERTDFIHSPPIGAAVVLERFGMKKLVYFFIKELPSSACLFRCEALFCKRRPFFPERVERVFSSLFTSRVFCVREHSREEPRHHRLFKKRVERRRRLLFGKHSLFFPYLHHNLFLKCLYFFNLIARLRKKCLGICFTKLVRPDFYHCDGSVFAADGGICREVAVSARFVGRIHHECPVPTSLPYTDGTHGSSPRDDGSRECQRRGVHRYDIRVVLVYCKHGDDHLHLIPHMLVKQGADGAVYDAAGKHRLIGGLSLAPDKAASEDGARRIKLFFVVNGEREEIYSLADGFAHDGSGKDRGFAVGEDDRAVRLVCKVRKCGGERFPAYFRGEFTFLHTSEKSELLMGSV